MAETSVWQAFASLPPAPFPCGYFWDTEEIRHQEHLHRVSHAQFLYSHRTDSPEAMRVYMDFIGEQNAWMAEQEELREREAQIAMKAYMDRASRWAEDWRRLERGETVEDVLMKTGATLITKSPFRPEHTVTCMDTDSMSLDDKSTTPNIPESLIDRKQSRNPCKGLLRFETSFTPEHFPGFDQVDGATAPRIQGSVPDPAEITQKQQRNLSRQAQCKPPEKVSSRGSGVDTHLGANAFVAKPIISFPPPGLGPPIKSGTENFDTSKLPSTMTSFPRQGTGLAGGEVIKICSHKRWTDGGDLLYEVLWKPHDLNIPPLKVWARSSNFMDPNKKIILDEYHLRNKLGTMHWRSQGKKRLRTSGSLGVKEIKEALDERKRSLIASERYDNHAAEFLGKCRWMMRGEWQQKGRGWAAAIEVAERWKKAWQDADEAETQIGHNLEPEVAFGAKVNADGNDISCWNEAGSKDVSTPPVVPIDHSLSFKQLDGGHVIDPERDHDPQHVSSDNHGVTGKDGGEWRSLFGGVVCLDPTMVDVTDSSAIGGISELGGITKTSPKPVETRRIGHSESLTPEIRNVNKTKGEFINLLNQDRFTRKSMSEATSTFVSVQSVSEAGSHLAHEQETFLSRPSIKDRHQNSTMDATIADYGPILQPSGVMGGPAGLSRTPATIITPFDGETGEVRPESQNEMPQFNCTATQEVGRGEVRTQDFVTRGVLTRDVAIQAYPSPKSCLAEAGTCTGDYSSTQAAEYVRSPVLSFGGDGVHMSSLGWEEASEGDSGSNTERRKESGSKQEKHEGELGAESDRDRNPPRGVAFPQELAFLQDGVSLPVLLDELWKQGEAWSAEEALAPGGAPAEEEARTKQELATQGSNGSYERAKARGRRLKDKKNEEGLTREERKEYRKLKKLLVRYRVTRWCLGQLDILIELYRQQQQQQRVWGALPGLCEMN